MPLVSSVGLEEKSLGLFLQIRTVQPKVVLVRLRELTPGLLQKQPRGELTQPCVI